jgi:hypothetical protein
MSLRWTRLCVGLTLLALPACAKRESPAAPTRLYSITGRVQLSGPVVDTSGVFLGTRVVGDADGVSVDLLHGTQVVGTTTTVDGIYRFTGLRPGDYVARTRVGAVLEDETNPLVIAVIDLTAADTLRLVSHGDLRPVPNPFVDTTQVYFHVADSTFTDIDIYDVSGRPVRNLLSLDVHPPPSDQAVYWYGRDIAGHPVTGSLFWVIFVAGPDVRAALLFKDPPGPRPAR